MTDTEGYRAALEAYQHRQEHPEQCSTDEEWQEYIAELAETRDRLAKKGTSAADRQVVYLTDFLQCLQEMNND